MAQSGPKMSEKSRVVDVEEVSDKTTPGTVTPVTDSPGGLIVPTNRPGRISFRDMAEAATVVVEGYDLVKGKEALIGVPFACLGVTYRDGISEGDVRRVNYISMEIITADAATIGDRVQRGSIPTPVLVGAEEMLVINDGSTGIARQVTEMLHRMKLINIGPVGLETGGEMGESPFDRYREDWVSGKDEAEAGIKGYPLFMAPRGLRVSEYDIPGTKKKAKTFYLG